MSTVNAVIERLFRTYLEPPDAQPVQVALAANVTDNLNTTVVLGMFTIAEDENLMRQGSLLEIDQELMRVTAYDGVTRNVTVERGVYGTEATTHYMPKMVKVNPAFPRMSVFETVRDNISMLYPSLFTTQAVALASVSGDVFPISDTLIAEVLQVWPDQGSTEVNIDARTVEFHPQAAGPAIVTNAGLGSIWVRYRSRMGVAETEDDTLEELGVESVWTSIVMAGAAADLFAGRDLPASHVEWVGSVLQVENIQVGTRTQLSLGLARYRELLIDRFRKEMMGVDSNRIKVHQRPTMRQLT